MRKINSKTTIIIIFIVWLFSSFTSPRWNYKLPHNVIIWDVVSYYSILPAIFIYNDVMMRNLDEYPSYMKMKNWIWQRKAPDDRRIIKYTCGLAILYLPFFILGHLSALILQYPTDGYSNPYQFWMAWTGFFYAVIGIIFLRKILLKYFSDKITMLTLLSIGLGTNLYYYAAYETPMPHAINFGLFSLFVYYFIKFIENPKLKYTCYLGLLIGITSLTRPTNIVVYIIPFLYFFSVKQGVINGLKFIWNNKIKFIIILFLGIIVWLPQLFYWKYLSGSWLYYSYGEETFYWSKPEIIYGLFSYRKGLLVYTPIYIFALAGLFCIRKYIPHFFCGILIFTIINVYVIFCWWIWWYAGCYSQRAFIDTYAIMALPMAACYLFVSNNLKLKKYILNTIVYFLVFLSIIQTYQYRKNIIHYDSMTKDAYWASFGILGNHDLQLFSAPDYKLAKARSEKVETVFDF